MPETSPPDGGNSRVTMAELKRDLCNLIEVFKEERDETRKLREVVESRLRHLESQWQSSQTELARLDERQKTTTGALGVLIAIGSAIAAAVGAFVK